MSGCVIESEKVRGPIDSDGAGTIDSTDPNPLVQTISPTTISITTTSTTSTTSTSATATTISTTTTTTTTTSTTTLPPPTLEVIEKSFIPDPNGKGVLSGVVKNNGKLTITDVQIEGVFYDKNDSIIEIKKSYPIGNLNPGQSKSFKVYSDKLIRYTDHYDIVIHSSKEIPPPIPQSIIILTSTTITTTTTTSTTTVKSTTSPTIYIHPMDSDGDKIADTIDLCPNQRGELKYNGCPTPSMPPPSSSVYIPMDYQWIFQGKEYTWNPSFSKSLYDYYKGKTRPPTRDYAVYATDPYDDELISQIVDMFKSSADENGFDEVETTNFIISFVQSLPYTPDDVTTPYDEYPRYPLETLIDNGGDCEDTAILTAVLINEMGYGAVLLDLPKHMAVGVKCEETVGVHYTDDYDNDYCYLETTGEGWQIGQLPDEYLDAKATLRYLVAKPIITLDWASESVDADMFNVVYETTINVKNEGSATAENLRAWVLFDTTEDGMVYSQIEGNSYDLKAGSELKSVFTSSVPRGVYTRLRIVVIGDNFLIQEKVSKWFKT